MRRKRWAEGRGVGRGRASQEWEAASAKALTAGRRLACLQNSKEAMRLELETLCQIEETVTKAHIVDMIHLYKMSRTGRSRETQNRIAVASWGGRNGK